MEQTRILDTVFGGAPGYWTILEGTNSTVGDWLAQECMVDYYHVGLGGSTDVVYDMTTVGVLISNN